MLKLLKPNYMLMAPSILVPINIIGKYKKFVCLLLIYAKTVVRIWMKGTEIEYLIILYTKYNELT